MTPESYTIIAVGIALAGLILNGQRLIAELRRDLKVLRRDLTALGERIARLEGFMEGIRDAIAGKAA